MTIVRICDKNSVYQHNTLASYYRHPSFGPHLTLSGAQYSGVTFSNCSFLPSEKNPRCSIFAETYWAIAKESLTAKQSQSPSNQKNIYKIVWIILLLFKKKWPIYYQIVRYKYNIQLYLNLVRNFSFNFNLVSLKLIRFEHMVIWDVHLELKWRIIP